MNVALPPQIDGTPVGSRRVRVTVCRNPYDPADGAVRFVRPGLTLAKIAPRVGGRWRAMVMVNGVPVLRAHRGWHRRRVAAGDVVVFWVLPAGGNRGGSNPLRIFLQIALLAVAGPLAGALAGATTGFAFTAARAGILFAGSALINAALPAQRPDARNLPTASPTYSLDGQGNAARIGGVIPVQYGRVRCYPDLAALPYTEYAGEDQYLYQLFCLGCGEYDVEEIRIEDTPISSFAEVETQVVGPGEQVTLFPTQVVTSVEVSGQELPPQKAGTWSRSGDTVTVSMADHGFTTGQSVVLLFTTGGGPDGFYTVATVPGTGSFTVEAPGGGTSGDCIVETIVGGATGFSASAPGQVAHRLGFDVVCPQGLYRVDGSGDLEPVSVVVVVDVRQIDDAGAPIGTWTNLLTETITAKTATPVRRSFSLTPPVPGRYQVRARRGSMTVASNTFDQVLWGGLRAYLAEEQNWPPVTLIAVKMRATNNLSLQASRRINVLSIRKLPVWNGTTWSAPVPTRSIAWAIADAARDSDYGGGRPDRKIDLAALLALDAVWAGRGDTFNFRFDQPGTWWDAVQTIAAAGRARCSMQAAILRVARDRPQSVPVALFSMRSIIKGSFSVEYLLPPSQRPAALDVHYFDAETFAPEKVRIDLFGAAGNAPPARMEIKGVDNRPQVTREGSYQAAVTRYRRRLIRFETEMEGFLPAMLDLIAVQHDMPVWGRQAEVRGWAGASRTVTLTEPVEVAADTVIGLRRPNGSFWGPVAVSQGASEHELVLAEDPDFTPVTARDRERTHVVIGTSNVPYMPAIFLRARPRGKHRVAIEAISEDPAVHTAELGNVPPPRRASLLPRRMSKPVIDRRSLFTRFVPGSTDRVLIGWAPAPDADTYHIEMGEGLDPDDPEVAWTRVGETTGANFTANLLHPRRTVIRVRGVGLLPGDWVAATLGSLVESFWVGSRSDPFIVGTLTDPFWRNL